MARFAIVVNGYVENVVIWDGETECEAIEGAVKLPDSSPVSVGYTFDGENYTAPPLPPVDQLP